MRRIGAALYLVMFQAAPSLVKEWDDANRGLSTKFTGAALALALCASQTSAAAAVPIQSVNPLVAVSVYGTQASAQAACSSAATAAAGAAATAQGQAGCVLPATDAPPPVADAAPLPPERVRHMAIHWLA